MKCPGAHIGTKGRQCQSDGACRAVNLRKFENSGANMGSKPAPNFWGGTENLLSIYCHGTGCTGQMGAIGNGLEEEGMVMK